MPRATDAERFERLYRDNAHTIYRFLLRRTDGDWALAEDLCAVVFYEAWRRRDDVAADRPLLPWLYGVAVNVLRNSRRSARRREAAVRRLPYRMVEFDPTEEVAERVHAWQRTGDAREILERLSEEERDVVVLCLVLELSYRAAAITLQIPIGTVRSRLARARARLRTLVPAPDTGGAELP